MEKLVFRQQPFVVIGLIRFDRTTVVHLTCCHKESPGFVGKTEKNEFNFYIGRPGKFYVQLTKSSLNDKNFGLCSAFFPPMDDSNQMVSLCSTSTCCVART